jgi:TP901 family phage tail tape measure protein
MNNNTVVLTTLLNGEQAKKELDEMRVHAQTLSRTIDDLRKKGDFALAKTLEPDLRAARKSMRELQKQTIDVNHVLANLNTAKPKELKDAITAMNKQLDSSKIKRGSKEWNDLNSNIRKVRGELNKISTESKISESKISRLANGFNKYFAGITAAVASVTGLSFALRKSSEEMAQMDDAYADVQKTTGLTRDVVVEINEEFKKMDTRTAREELNMLARDAGKLGIVAKDEVLDFVEAGNQIDVALSEDLGDGAIRNIGKITEVFKTSTEELRSMKLRERMLAVGSAINELGQSSTANEAYLVNFTQRLGGVASQAGISVQDILGYASALDQSGQAVEMSATALQKFITEMMSEPAKFAKIAGIEVGRFNDLLKTDTNEAIKTVLQSLSEKGGFQQLIPIFKKMGLDGARAVGVLSALATNIDKISQAQEISNKAFADGTSLTEEYNVKNNNLMARLEKQRKAFKDARLELGERLNPALLKSTNLVTYIVKVLPDVLDFFAKYGPALVKISALILAYNIGLKANVMWKRMQIADTAKLIIWYAKESAQMTILSLKYVFASRSSAELNRSLKALWATTKLNPIGLLAAGITALIYGLVKWSNRNSKLITQSEAIIDVNKKAADSIGRERAELDMLLGIARNEKISKDERIKAINKLNEISPEYLGNLNLENINTDTAKKSIEKYTTAIMENAKQKAIADKMSELYSKRLELEAKIAEQETRKSGAGSEIRNIADRNIARINNEIEGVDKQIKVYQNLGEQISENKKKSYNAYTEKWMQLQKEQSLLDNLEKQHADLFSKQIPSGVLKDPVFSLDTGFNKLADQIQLTSLSQRIERQKAIVAAKEKELEVTKEIVKEEDPVTPSGKTGDDALKLREAELKLSYDKQLLNLKNSLLEKSITEEQYNSKSYDLEVAHIASMIELRNEFNKSSVDLELQLTDKMISEANRRYKLSQDLLKQAVQDVKKRTGEEAFVENDDDWTPQGFSDEKGLLDQQREYEMISEEDYQQALYDLRVEYLSRYLDKATAVSEGIQDITADLSGAVAGFQQAEEMSVERKYDKMIKAAGNNAIKVAQLEEEKEKSIHAVRAKYAEKQFIITVANVIASTSVAAMDSYKAMAGIPVVGPALGAAAAAAAILYGAGQIAVAKQQKDVAKEGYASGGYTQKGNWWEEDGTVHKSEFVGNHHAVANPSVRRIFDIVDQAQRNNTIGSLSERDFQTALNYSEFSQRRSFNEALSNFQPVINNGGSLNELTNILARSAEINDKLYKKLEDPLVSETYIEGKGGIKRANDLYNRMKRNISRT